jgi:CRISPR-associated protein Csx14
MADERIPVELLNPGQVFACLGFLEAADVLLGGAEGGFDWSHEPDVFFQLRGPGGENPFGTVLRFLAEAELQRIVPTGYADPQDSKGAKKRSQRRTETRGGDSTDDGPMKTVETFPQREAEWRTLPVRLERDGRSLDVTHWCDGSSRNEFKLFAGQQRSAVIAKGMLLGMRRLWKERPADLESDPFGMRDPGMTLALGGSSFKLDARKSWTAIDAGYSPDEQGNLVVASPVVEILAAIGLEHARPNQFATREVRYGAWDGLLPPVLARPALGGVAAGTAVRVFRFALLLAGKNKVVTFAEEETSHE